jgi:hypothetical protein
VQGATSRQEDHEQWRQDDVAVSDLRRPQEPFWVYQGQAMNLNQGKLIDGLVEDLLKTIHKYDESLYMATVIGALEFVKQQLIQDGMEQDEE